MKKLIFSIAIFISSIQAHSQDSLKYDYAILKIKGYVISVEYSDPNDIIYLRDTLKINWETETILHARFMSFNYLNARGYELVSSLGYEYIFKRPKKNKK